MPAWSCITFKLQCDEGDADDDSRQRLNDTFLLLSSTNVKEFTWKELKHTRARARAIIPAVCSAA
jgi:hypothetical protein